MENKAGNSPLIQGLKEYFEQTPKEVLDRELSDLERFNGFGPVVEVSMSGGVDSAIPNNKDEEFPQPIRIENKSEKFNGNMRVGDMWFEYTTILEDELGFNGVYLCVCVITNIRHEYEDCTDYDYKQYIMGGDGRLSYFATLPCDGVDKELNEVSCYTDFGIMSRDLFLLKHLLETERENGYKVRGYHSVMEICRVWLEKFKENGGWHDTTIHQLF